jgi:rubrerythrin
MESHEMVRHLGSLVHLDVDAVHVYDEAIEHVTEDAVRTRFTEFRDEHDYHATVIAAEIRAMGEEPPQPREDLVGELAELVTGLRATRGTEGAVAAMRTAERYHNRRYREAQEWDLPPKLKEVVERFYADEQRHLEFCEKWLATPAHR